MLNRLSYAGSRRALHRAYEWTDASGFDWNLQLFNGGSKNASEQNANEKDLQQKQGTIQQSAINTQTLIAQDIGTGNTVPTPPGIPSVAAVFGPSEESIMAATTPSAIVTAASDANATITASEPTILESLASSANGANLPLGPQYSLAPVYDDGTDAGGGAPSAQGGSSVSPLVIVAVALVGGAGFLFFRQHKHASA